MEQRNLGNNDQMAKYSRVLTMPRVFALGASVSLGVGIFGVLGILLGQFSPSELKKPFLLLLVLAIPIVLTYVEKAVNLRDSNGIYGFLKQSDELWTTFFGSWFLVLGYIAVISLSASLIGTYAQSIIETYLGYKIDARYITAGIIILQTVSIFIRRGIRRSIRTSFVIFAVVLLGVILFQGFFPAQPVEFMQDILGHEELSFNVLSLLMASLWGLFFIYRERKAIIKPRETILPISILIIVLIVFLGFISVWILDAHGINYQTLIPLAELNVQFHYISNDVIVIVYTFLVIGCAFYVLRKSYYDSVHFVNLMIADGFLIRKTDKNKNEFYWLWPVVVLSITSLVMIFTSSILSILGFMAFTFFVVTIFINIPAFIQPKPKLSNRHYLKLPFHPLFPGLVTAISLLLIFPLPQFVVIIGVLYGVIGIAYYLFIARNQAVISRRNQLVIAEELNESESTERPYRIMVGVAKPDTAVNLIETAIHLAKARQGEVLVLRTITYTGEMSEINRRRKAQAEYDALVELITPINSDTTSVKPIIRLSAEAVEGILDTVEEENVDLLLLGWEDKTYNRKSFMNTFMNEILRNADCEVAIMSGQFPKRLRQIGVPTAGGPYASMGLGLACDLAEAEKAKVSLVNVIQGKMTPIKKEQANQRLEETRSVIMASSQASVEPRVVDGENILKRLAREANRTDLMMIGASKEGVLERPYFGGLPVELAAETRTPIMITRGLESTQRVFLQRVWGALFDSLPSLNVNRRKEVMKNMQNAAKPTPDFFVLIVLASMIASLGLLQNSAAVIIGAMLVAPLMSPILSMGMSLVIGNIRQFYEATETAVKGIAVAILVGTIISIFSPINAATSEIMARTAPNILDLMVAIASGAAAGYAMSRKEVSAAMPGVAISAALVPPLCVIGYGLGTAQFDIASGSALLFITNLIAILLSAAVVFLALGFYPQRTNREELMRTLRITLISLVAVTSILVLSTITTVNQANREQRVNEVFNQFVEGYEIEILDFEIHRKRDEYVIESTFIEKGEREIAPEDMANLQHELEQAVNGNVSIDATILSAMHLDTKFINQENAILYHTITEQLQNQLNNISDVSIQEKNNVIIIRANIVSNQTAEDIEQSLKNLKEIIEEETLKQVEIEINLIAGETLRVE